jgi:hypothetical protein
MIEREGAIKIYNEVLGAKGAKGRLVRVSEDGFYEVLVDIGGKAYTGLLPISTTVILAAEPEEEIATVEVER